MSYSYDVMRRVFDARIGPHVPDARIRLLFGFLIDAMHEANHRVKDGINKDGRVIGAAKALADADAAVTKAEGGNMTEACSHVWIDLDDPPINRSPISPVIGPGQREMHLDKLYRCQKCAATVLTKSALVRDAAKVTGR